MKHFPIHSLRTHLYASFLILLLSFLGLLIYNNYSAINIIRQNACTSMQDVLAISQSRLNDTTVATEKYLINFIYDSGDITLLENEPPSTTRYFSALYRLQKNFNSFLPIYPVDGFFLYSLPPKNYVASVRSAGMAGESSQMRELLCSLMSDSKAMHAKVLGKWFTLKTSDGYYLVRIFAVHNSYVGAWISIENALKPLSGGVLANSDIFLLGGDGSVLSNQSPTSSLPTVTNDEGTGYSFVNVQGKNDLIVTQKASFGNFYLTALVDDQSLSSGINRYTTTFSIVLICTLIILFFVAISMQRWIMKPIHKLTSAIVSLRNGNFGVSVESSSNYKEFREVNQAFNEMVQQIETLKINVYEEKLNKQEVQLQYLKLQITPHFLINCLNIIYQLTETSHPDLSRKMLRDLSQHLRYTLSSRKTVQLGQELQHVFNYIDLSQICYPNCIQFETDYDEQTFSATAIPLLVQNFIENTIKYEVVMGQSITIHVSSKFEKMNDKEYVHLCIWDTGSGFSQDMLEQLQDLPEYIRNNSNRHIGISNVFQRAEIILPESSFKFSNRTGAGAQIDIRIPYIPFSEAKK